MPRTAPIKRVLGGPQWFVAVREDNLLMGWGEIPDFLPREMVLRGSLLEVHVATTLAALVWEGRQVEVWDAAEERGPNHHQAVLQMVHSNGGHG